MYFPKYAIDKNFAQTHAAQQQVRETPASPFPAAAAAAAETPEEAKSEFDDAKPEHAAASNAEAHLPVSPSLLQWVTPEELGHLRRLTDRVAALPQVRTSVVP